MGQLRATYSADDTDGGHPTGFHTPRALARRMATLAGIVPPVSGLRVLEPSAGTGVLISELVSRGVVEFDGQIVAVEIDPVLAQGLAEQRKRILYATERNVEIRCGDFLEIADLEPLSGFDVVLMHPPFKDGADIQHIERARAMLKPGGILVALCANGPRQAERLRPHAASWEELAADTFKEQGTDVRGVLLSMLPDASGGESD